MKRLGVVYRDKRGVEYVSASLPTHEVRDAVPLNARIVSKRQPKTPVPVYEGTDGAELAMQPRGHRRHWTDAQWLALEEHRQLEAEHSRDDVPFATVMIIKPTQLR